MDDGTEHVALMDVDTAFLVEALHLPKGTVLVDVFPHRERRGVWVFRVAHPDLPEVQWGCFLRHVSPTFSHEMDGNGKLISVKFEDWGL